MPKIKTKKSASKRFNKTGNGGFKCKHSHLRHILTKKRTSRKRKLRSPDNVEKSDLPMVRKMLPYA